MNFRISIGGKRVLVTGHTGFKGSWLVRILMNMGADVTGYALKGPTDPCLFDVAGLEDHMDSVEGDVRDLAHLKEVFERVRPGGGASLGGTADCAGFL